MEKLNGEEIRSRFLEFFESKDHLVIPGAPLVPKNDPTLLYINSGMAPLKKYFLGLEQPPNKRLVNYQPCIRTIDIDDVGDRHHMTMFEMLGSWSIGDYYKQKAAELAYDLLVNHLKFPKEKLYFSAYGGDSELKLAADKESITAWKSVGVPDDHIVVLGADNFWGPAGDTGPCGPCTEVFFDTGENFGEAYKPGKEFDSKGRYIEIWNAGVFMEFNKNADGSFLPLPLKSVDTGSGLERMEFVMNGFKSVYEIAALNPIMNLAQDQFGSKSFGVEQYRILTDHLRAATFILAENVKLSNEGRGYIPRKLLRKCLTLGLRADTPSTDFSSMIELIVKNHQKAYPHLAKNLDRVLTAVQNEVRDYEPLISRGKKMLEDKIATLKSNQKVPSDFIFDLVATYGVPFDLIKEAAKEKNVLIDDEGFQSRFDEHRNVSRQIKTGPQAKSKTDVTVFDEHMKDFLPTHFKGYDALESSSQVMALFKDGATADKLEKGEEGYLVCTNTPFYAESGGQVGDHGVIRSKTAELEVLDVLKREKRFFHHVQVKNGTLHNNDKIDLVVNAERRLQIRAHHSATHLLHAALRKIVGPQAVQKGSMVTSDRLRFDFQNDSAVTPDQLREIERLVNHWIRDNYTSHTREMEIKAAIAEGAIAMFEEKYENTVRVISFGDKSLELCGGTHVHATGDIGAFFVLSESSVAKGIRRIEGVAAQAAIQFVQERNEALHEACVSLNTKPQQLLESILKLKEKKSAPELKAQAKIQSQKTQKTKSGKSILLIEASGETAELRTLLDEHHAKEKSDLSVLIFTDQDKLGVMINSPSAQIPANKILVELMKSLDGRGGGKPTFAQGVGKPLLTAQQILDQVSSQL